MLFKHHLTACGRGKGGGGFFLVRPAAFGQPVRMVDDAMSRLKELFLGAQAAWHGHSDGVAEEAELSRPQAFIHFQALTVKSFIRNRVPVGAAALSYSSLLALVPMLALVVSVAFGFLRGTTGRSTSRTSSTTSSARSCPRRGNLPMPTRR